MRKAKERKWLIWSLNSFKPVAFLFHIHFPFFLVAPCSLFGKPDNKLQISLVISLHIKLLNYKIVCLRVKWWVGNLVGCLIDWKLLEYLNRSYMGPSIKSWGFISIFSLYSCLDKFTSQYEQLISWLMFIKYVSQDLPTWGIRVSYFPFLVNSFDCRTVSFFVEHN